MHLFYTPDLITHTYTLSEEESKHCVRVLRLQNGSKIVLIDGVGTWHDAVIIEEHPKRCKVEIVATKKEVGKRSFNLHIALAPTKNNDRTEWFLEKVTEIGIDELTLLNCANSERTAIKQERLVKVAVAAMKQSLKAYLPPINDLKSFKSFITESSGFDGQKYIAHCGNSAPPHLAKCYQKGENALILIGPEGDFSPDEIKLAKAEGFQEISLGASRLRTETAGVYACTVINSANE
jgi:16S rRNA (uracil1498-N3)-methyltransferase